MTHPDLYLTAVVQAQERLDMASEQRQDARQDLRDAITEARKGHTLADIGRALGMTRQGVYDLLNR